MAHCQPVVDSELGCYALTDNYTIKYWDEFEALGGLGRGDVEAVKHLAQVHMLRPGTLPGRDRHPIGEHC